ncbi:MAG: TonB-dependent receptor [bacterium]
MKTISAAIFICFFTNLQAQNYLDSTKIYHINQITVTADRFENDLLNRTSSINIISANDIKNFGGDNLVSALNQSSGLSFSNMDGLGKIPVLTTRGFYGGGESEYVTLLYDGMLVNDVENGIINWNLLPINNINSIEIIKGGSSSLYGDFSIGGVINVIPSFNDSIFNSLSIGAGNNGFFRGKYILNNHYKKLDFGIYFSNEQIDGYRNHSSWRDVSFGGKINYQINSNSKIKLLSINQINKYDMPGPNTESAIIKDRINILPYFNKDNKDEKRFFTNIEYKYYLSNESEFAFGLMYKHKTAKEIETFINIAPIIELPTMQVIGQFDTTFFGDTNEREFIFNEFGFNVNSFNNIKNLDLKFSIGSELNYSLFSNKYYNWFSGFKTDYVNNLLSRSEETINTSGNRFKGALYLNSELQIFKQININLGVRFDYINDKLNGTKPDTSFNISSNAFSPKFGINYKYNNIGSIYFNYTRSFKSPTVNQLTDLSRLNFVIFVPYWGGYSKIVYDVAPFNNTELKPQFSNNYEIGLIQLFNIIENIKNRFSVTAYYSTVKDEIDFDLKSYRYQNLLNTIHKGIELDLITSINKFNTYLNFTYNSVRFDNGEYKSNYLKGIPTYFGNIGLSYMFNENLQISVGANYNGGTYLEDENKYTLSSCILFNSNLTYKYSFFKISIYASNIFNKHYFLQGYILGEKKLLYPSAGTIIKGEITCEF